MTTLLSEITNKWGCLQKCIFFPFYRLYYYWIINRKKKVIYFYFLQVDSIICVYIYIRKVRRFFTNHNFRINKDSNIVRGNLFLGFLSIIYTPQVSFIFCFNLFLLPEKFCKNYPVPLWEIILFFNLSVFQIRFCQKTILSHVKSRGIRVAYWILQRLDDGNGGEGENGEDKEFSVSDYWSSRDDDILLL